MGKIMLEKSVRKTWAWLLVTIMVVGLATPLCISAIAGVNTVTISESSGWLESAYVEWTPVSGATGYNVYYKAASAEDSQYVQLDDMLIREYATYYRADIVGLSSGNYVMKVVPVKDGVQVTDKSAVTGSLIVEAYDRTGFAWSGTTNGTGDANGAYNSDGTLKENALVIYVCEANKDTVTAEIITSTKGTLTSASGLQNILNLVKKGYETRPIDIRLIGNVSDLSTMSDGDIVIDGNKKSYAGVTFEGIGEDATANGWGLRIKSISNVEVRNIGFMNCDSGEGDDIGLQQDNDHVWVHNCDFFYGDAGSDADQIKGDGSLDCKKSTYITFSYNHFWDNGKCNLLGLSENTTEDLYITYHHNWYDHSDSRHPRVRFYTAHVYNNYYDGNSKYGIGACLGSSIYAENNYFRNCTYPMLISMQGSDVYDTSTNTNNYTGDMPTFSKEAGGMIKAYGNVIIGAKRFVTQEYSSTDFDAIVVSSADEQIDSSEYAANMGCPSGTEFKTGSAGNTYNNFDTSSIMYVYTADTAEAAKTNVEKYAGRINGGDFKWNFDNDVDDTSSSVNTELKSALDNYSIDLVNVGGFSVTNTEDETTEAATEGTTAGTTVETTTQESTTIVETTTASNVTANSYIHDFTTDGKSSTFYSITGNLSTGKGTVSYSGITLTRCLKIESSTKITFTATDSGTLILVLDENSTKKVKVDGESHAATSGIVKVDLESGSHTIAKGDSANLFYMVFEEN